MSSPDTLTRQAVADLYGRGLLSLVFEAAEIHRREHDPAEIQCASLLSVKTGGCSEDCAYCPQSAHYPTGVDDEPLMSVETVVETARTAKANGADRFCLGAAWREVSDGPEFDRVLHMITAIKTTGLETCVTLGMLAPHQAVRLREDGLDFYNHNLDTGREFYSKIITTRTYDDRLNTLQAVRDAGLKVCCGGILGMGESHDDRIDLLYELACQTPQLESVPINTLVPVDGTPLESQAPVAWDDLVRVIAVARLLMPRAKIRLSAGRSQMSDTLQAFCFLAGANSVFLGDRLLTTPNNPPDQDLMLLERLGLRAVQHPGSPANATAEADRRSATATRKTRESLHLDRLQNGRDCLQRPGRFVVRDDVRRHEVYDVAKRSNQQVPLQTRTL